MDTLQQVGRRLYRRIEVDVASSKGEDAVTTKTKVDQDRRLFYVLLRYSMDLDQAGFAAATRTSPSQVSKYTTGTKTVPDAVLDRAVNAAAFPRALVQPALRAIRSFRAAARGWSRVDRVLSETFFAELLAWSGEALEAIFTAAAPAPPRRAHDAPCSEGVSPFFRGFVNPGRTC
jgi:hypothetical protein